MIDGTIKLIKLHEGQNKHGDKHVPYKDIVGKLTIGYGRNLDDVGLSDTEAESLLWNDVRQCVEQLSAKFSWFSNLDAARRTVLIDMCYNMGITGLSKFVNMLNHVSVGNYALAAEEMLNSKWAVQVKGRATRLIEMMKTGLYPKELI